MNREEAIYYLKSSGMSDEQIKSVIDAFTCEDCISREEAIGIVARIKEMHIDDREQYPINYGTICDIDLALQRLPSVTPSYNSVKTELKPCEDCISRESLRQKLQEHHDFFVNAYGSFKDMTFKEKARVDEIDNCIAMVVNAPSVTPSRPKGKWILEEVKDEDGRPYDVKYYCSECQAEGPPIWVDYCSACGAEMEIENEKETC